VGVDARAGSDRRVRSPAWRSPAIRLRQGLVCPVAVAGAMDGRGAGVSANLDQDDLCLVLGQTLVAVAARVLAPEDVAGSLAAS
jgi:hypothetical protein